MMTMIMPIGLKKLFDEQLYTIARFLQQQLQWEKIVMQCIISFF